MPLLRFDVIAGRSREETTALLDAAHDAMVESFEVPPRDRYQVVHEHEANQVRFEDTGLGIERTDKCILLQVTTRPRSRKQKEAFYKRLCESLQERCGIAPSDVIVSLVTSTDEDWSFGRGRGQFLTGEL